MMPVGTAPNAIAFGTGLIRMPQMMKAGFWLNLAGILVIVALSWLFITPLLGNVYLGAGGAEPGNRPARCRELSHAASARCRR